MREGHSQMNLGGRITAPHHFDHECPDQTHDRHLRTLQLWDRVDTWWTREKGDDEDGEHERNAEILASRRVFGRSLKEPSKFKHRTNYYPSQQGRLKLVATLCTDWRLVMMNW